jgi:hypothetical protein
MGVAAVCARESAELASLLGIAMIGSAQAGVERRREQSAEMDEWEERGGRVGARLLTSAVR